MFKIIIFILGALVAQNNIAAEWVENIGIKTIEVQPNGNVYLLADKPIPNQGCPHNGSYLQFDTDAPNFDQQYSLVLAAYMGNKKIRVYVNGCGAYAYAQNTFFEY